MVDECALDLDNCDQNAACIDLPEGFMCVCNDGYTGDGVFCVGEYDIILYIYNVYACIL